MLQYFKKLPLFLNVLAYFAFIFSQLAQLTGGDSAFLEDIWNEKYRKDQEDEENEEFHESDEINTSSFDSNRCCQVCERQVKLTRHHLIPRQTHKAMLKKGITKETLNQTIPICRLCHSTIHRFFTHEQLALQFNTVEKLLVDKKFYKFAKWSSSLSNSRYAGSVK